MSEGDFIQKNFHQHGSSAQKSWTAKKKSVNADVNHSVYIQPQGSDLLGRKTQTMSGVAQYGLHQCKNENAKSSKYVNRHIFNTALLDRRDSNDGSTAHVQSNDAIVRVSKSTGINLSNVTISEHDKDLPYGVYGEARHGKNVVLANSEENNKSELAIHELIHIAQQRGGNVHTEKSLTRQQAEEEAETQTSKVLRGEHIEVHKTDIPILYKDTEKKMPSVNDAIQWNDEHFKSASDPDGAKTWALLAEKLHVPVSSNITLEEKKHIVKALMERQKSLDKTSIPDGFYGSKSIRSFERNDTFLPSDTETALQTRQDNILRFLVHDDKFKSFNINLENTAYLKRHARYLTEFMAISDLKDRNKGDERLPSSLVFRMIVDDLTHPEYGYKNIGLLALWIGTGEWGITGLEYTNITDPAKAPGQPDWYGPAKSKGKRAREYEQGGVGIADLDTEHLAQFYKTFGEPAWAKDAKVKLYQDKNKKSATPYDSVKSYHVWSETMARLFERGDGTQKGDEWNDKATIWVMEYWLSQTWSEANRVMQKSPMASTYARMKNSSNMAVSKGTFDSPYPGENDKKIIFIDINALVPYPTMEEQYGHYGALKHGSKDPRGAQSRYKSRLRFTQRVSILQNYVQRELRRQSLTISEDGKNILNCNGDIVDMIGAKE